MEAKAIERIEELSEKSCVSATTFGSQVVDQTFVVPAAIVPAGRKVESMENLLDRPVFQRVTYTTERLPDFCRYVDAEAQADLSREPYQTETKSVPSATAVFVKPDGSGAQALIDFGTHAKPNWGRHKAVLAMKHTPEFAACLGIHGKSLNQRALIEWLEDWGHIITAINATGETIAMPKAIAAIRKIDLKAKRETSHEEQNFAAKRTAMEEIEATSGDGTLPAQLDVTLQVYPCTKQRTVTLRLSLLTGGDVPALKPRIVGLDALEKEVAEEIELEIVTRLANKARVFAFAPRPSGCETGHPSLSFAFGHAAANSFCPDTSRVRFALLGDSTAPEGLSGASRHRAARYPCLVVGSV